MIHNNYIYSVMGTRLLAVLAVLFSCSIAVSGQTKENVLLINDFEAGVGKVINVPVYLTNTDEVIAAQFDVSLPFAIPASGTAMLSNRADGHSASFSALGNNSYRVVVMSVQNNALRGNAGLFLRLPMQTYDDGGTAQSYPIAVSNIVLTDRRGNNIATAKTAKGTYTVNRDDLPDLIVPAVTLAATQAAPGGSIGFSYDVKNDGKGATRAGWTERFYLQGNSGTRTFIGSQQYVSTLVAGATVSRSFTATLPAALHIDGQARLVVEVVPGKDTGELIADQGNNEGISAATLTLSKLLTLTADRQTVREGGSPVYATLTRSGDWSIAETFTISCSVANLLTCNGQTLPCKVTMPVRSAGASLRIAAVDDQIVRARAATITVSSTTGYQPVSLTLDREDNDLNPLSLKLSAATIAEGATLTLTATRGGELTDVLDIPVACSHSLRFSTMPVLHFGAGQSLATATVTALDDDIAQLDASVRFSLQADDYKRAAANATLQDDDRPAITMTLSRPTVMENEGSSDEAEPLTATIRRDRGTDKDMTVWLTSTRNEVVFERNKVVIPAGSSQVEVAVSIADNNAVDGQRTATLAAAYYSAYDMAAAASGDRAYASQQLTVCDDESPYLTLSSNVNAVGEGASVQLTVRRYQPSTAAPLSVTLSCTDSRVSFSPQPVTIAAGRTSATVTMNVARNSIENDDSSILLTAKASGMGNASLRLNITDRTLPDAVNPTIECVGEHFYSGQTATVRATIRNMGTATLPKGMTIDFYLAGNRYLYWWTTKHDFFKATTDREIAAGGEQTFEFSARLPQMVGKWWVYARLNRDGKIAEFNTGNNLTARFCPITIEAPFEVSLISASPKDLVPGDVLNVVGYMNAVEGSLLNGQTVRVKLSGSGQSSWADTKIDAYGRFDVSVKIDRSASGYLTVNALALGQTEPARTTQVHVYNMSLSAASTRWTVDENIQAKGAFTLRNMSAKPIKLASISTTQPLPDGAELIIDTQALGQTIAGGASVSIPYTVKGTKPSAEWQHFTVTAKSTNGLVAQLPISYFCQATSSYLVFTPRELKTTMLFNADRHGVEVTVKNCGKKATGKISELLTADWVMSDFGNNRTLQPGETATLHLTFLAQDYMHAGRTYRNYLQLMPDNGTAATLPITVTTTGTELSAFSLQATDVYSKANGDFSHLAGATVTITNVRTGAVFMTGALDGSGQWQTTAMREGTYDVTVKAPRHRKATRRLAVGPGEDCSVEMLLPYRALMADFVVDQNLEDTTYVMRQYFDIDSMAPQAIIFAQIPDEGFGCDTEVMEIVLRNIGSRAATGMRLTFPVVGGYTFNVLNGMPAVMQPGDTHVLRVACTGPATGDHRIIATMRMYYEFDINGETLSEYDDYQVLTGCVKSGGHNPLPTVPQPGPGKGPGGEGPGGGGPGGGGNPGPGVGIALPTYGCYMKVEFEDISTLRCGQPLRATLTVCNRQKEEFRSLRFTPQESDTNYEDCTALFTHSEVATAGFTADGAYHRLAGGCDGTLELTFTPKSQAAAGGATKYYVGGQLSYIDSRTGIHNTASLPLFEITVLPSGDVELTYLLQRNFLADDADTEEVEDAEPAMFVLLARNHGAVDAGPLKVAAKQPVVVANTSARPVAYTAQYAAVDGQQGNYSFSDFELASVAAGTTTAARWLYSSEQSAHVRSMTSVADGVSAAHGSGASVRVTATHELVRAVASPALTAATAADDDNDLDQKVMAMAQGNVYLLNDIDDELSLPDAVINANGDNAELNIVSGRSTMAQTGATGNYTLTVKAGKGGWMYGRLHDPTNGTMRLESVSRQSDGRTVSLASFWQTDRTPQADYSMMQENMLHFADSIKGTEETYTLHFVQRDSETVELIDIKMFAADGTEVKDGATTAKAVKKIQMEFTGSLKRLNYTGLVLTSHGEAQDIGNCQNTGEYDKRRWTLDVSSLDEIPGLHTFCVKASKMKPLKGKAIGTKEVSWTEDIDGSALITLNVAPDNSCGYTTPATGLLPFGNQSIKATAQPGFQFVSWTDDVTGEVLTRKETVTIDVWKARSLTANFAVRPCNVTITCDNGGVLTGNTSGVYTYGEEILLAAQPNVYYKFNCWLKDGKKLTETQTARDVVTGDHVYQALFYDNGVGDVNVDGKRDVADIAAVITYMAADKYDKRADVNGDGVVDVADIATLITIISK